MKKQYQINKERAVQKFRSAASTSEDAIQLALPMKEAVALVQEGLMQLALATFTQMAEQMMRWEVDQIAGPKQKANARREAIRWRSKEVFITEVLRRERIGLLPTSTAAFQVYFGSLHLGILDVQTATFAPNPGVSLFRCLMVNQRIRVSKSVIRITARQRASDGSHPIDLAFV